MTRRFILLPHCPGCSPMGSWKIAVEWLLGWLGVRWTGRYCASCRAALRRVVAEG